MAERGTFPKPSVSWGKNVLENQSSTGKDELESYLKSQGAGQNPASSLKTEYQPLLKTSSNDSLNSADQNVIFSNSNLVFNAFFEKLGAIMEDTIEFSSSDKNIDKNKTIFKGSRSFGGSESFERRSTNHKSPGGIKGVNFQSPIKF